MVVKPATGCSGLGDDEVKPATGCSGLGDDEMRH